MSAASWQSATEAEPGCDAVKMPTAQNKMGSYFKRICLPLALFSSNEPLGQSMVVSTFSMLQKEVPCHSELALEVGTGGLVVLC